MRPAYAPFHPVVLWSNPANADTGRQVFICGMGTLPRAKPKRDRLVMAFLNTCHPESSEPKDLRVPHIPIFELGRARG
jgi:hypothetical protein